MTADEWKALLGQDPDDILDYSIRVPLTDAPSEARILLEILGTKTEPDRTRMYAAFSIEALPPAPGVKRSWSQEDALDIIERLEAVLSSEDSEEVAIMCQRAIRAIKYHSVNK